MVLKNEQKLTRQMGVRILDRENMYKAMETGSVDDIATQEMLNPLHLLKIAHCNTYRYLQK